MSAATTPGVSPAPAGKRLRIVFLPRVVTNPYLPSLAAPMERAGHEVAMGPGGPLLLWRFGPIWRCDVVHVHWPQQYLMGRGWLAALAKSAVFLSLLWLLRLRGARIAWTAHNLTNHEAVYPRTQWLLTRKLIAASHVVLVHSQACGDAVAGYFKLRRLGKRGQSKLRAVPHAHYIADYPHSVGRGEARERLGVPADAFTYLFVGALRGYKGVSELIEAFGKLEALGDPAPRLLIAGKARDDATDRTLRQLADHTPGVSYTNAFVEADQMQFYMAAADVVVLPYRKILTSGTLLLSASFGKVTIVPDAPTLLDTVDPQAVLPFDRHDPGALEAALAQAATLRDELPARGDAGRRAAARWGWDEMAAATLEAYGADA
ncbi:MAG: glycosyltransferase [Planctomycetota bacterium]